MAPRRFPERERGGFSLSAVELPPWLDRQAWAFTAQIYQRLVAKAGDDERAAEVLQIIAYNETHGPEPSRIRNRHALLMAYLNGQVAEIFPNDDHFETLAMRRERVKLELARREQQLAEEALDAQRQAERAKALAALTEAQRADLREEARRRVDATVPDFVRNREELYREEERRVLDERLAR
jgi:hypothetical protein